MLESHRPYPCFAIDRHWNVVASNRAVPEMYEGVAEELRVRVNAMRISLHPRGLAPRIANLPEWRAHLLARLTHQVGLTADPALIALLTEIRAYPAPDTPHRADPSEVLVPLKLRTSLGTLSFFSTTMVFGTPVDITLSELAVESFFPADDATVAAVKTSQSTI